MSRLASPLLILALSGCAAHHNLKLGDALADDGNWADALDHYEIAHAKRPNDPGVDAKVEKAARMAVGDYVDSATAAIDGSDLRSAHDALEAARKIDPASDEIAMLTDRLAEVVVATVHKDVVSGDLDVAYRVATEARGWYPARADLDGAVTEVREAVHAEAVRLTDAGRFSDAMARIALIGSYEQNSTDLPRWRGAIALKWADDLMAKAKVDEKAGRIASAYVRTTGAAAIGGRTDDAAARDRLRAALVGSDGLIVDVNIRGDGDEAARLDDAIARGVHTAPAVHVADVKSPGLVVNVTLGTPTYGDTVTTEVGEQRYLAGTRQIANPAFAARLGDEERAADDAVRARHAEHEVRGMLIAAQHELDDARDDLRPLAEAHELAQTRLREAGHAADDALARMQTAEADVETARTSGADLAGPAAALATARTAYLDARGRVEAASTDEVTARDPWQTATARVASAEEAVASREQDVASAGSVTLRAEEAALAAVRALDGVPPIIDDDLWATYRYPIEDHTRQCGVTAMIDVGGATRRLGGQASTTDAWHRAYVQYGVSEDPLQYAVSDDALAAAAWRTVEDPVVTAINGAIDAWRGDLVRRAQTSPDAEGATKAWVVAALANPSASPPGFDAFLAAQYPGIDAAWIAP